MKKYLLIILISLFFSGNIYSNALEIKDNRLYLWDTYKIQFGTYNLKLYDNIKIINQGDNKFTIYSKNMYTVNGDKKNIELKVDFTEFKDHIDINFLVNFHEKVELKKGFGMFIQNIPNSSCEVKNHVFSKETRRKYIEGYNTINFNNTMSLYFSNPLHQHLKFVDDKDYIFIEAIPHLKTRFSSTKNGPQEDIRQILDPGEKVKLSFKIYKKENPISPMISPIPDGHTEALMIIWDEIPMNFDKQTFMTFTTKDKTKGVVYNRMLELFNDFKKYKANMILSFDYVDPDRGGDRIDSSNGLDHYQILGPYRLKKNTPDSFKTWLSDIENNRKYPWTNRASLGMHALHHTYIDSGTVLKSICHEFDRFDSTEAYKVMDRVFDSIEKIGITKKSMNTMRFPGMKYTEASWQEIVERDIDFIDLGLCYNAENEHNFSKSWGRGGHSSWGIKTNYWTDYEDGDTEKKYSEFLKDLKKGFPILIGGHPNSTIGNKRTSTIKYNFYKKFLNNIEKNTEDDVFLLPDSLAIFWDKLYSVNIDSTIYNEKKIKINLSGNFPNKLTIVVPFYSQYDTITSKKCSISSIKIKRMEYYITLEDFKDSTIQIDIEKKDSINTSEVKIRSIPNPSLNNTIIYFYSSKVETAVYEIFSENGMLMKKEKFKFINNTYRLDLTEILSNYTGVYHVVIKDGSGNSRSNTFYKIKN